MKRPYSSKLIISIAILLGCNINILAQTTFPVPNVPGCSGVSGVIVNMRGGSGGASNSTGTSFSNGGAGGFGGSVVCTLNVATPVLITSLTYYVGTAGAVGLPVLSGTAGSAGGSGYGSGGNGGSFAGPSGAIGTDCPGGAGGGSSAVLNTTGAVTLLVAGGGGGGGALMTSLNGGNGGNPGTNGANAGTYNFGGAGGTSGTFGAAGGVGLSNNGAAAAGAPPGNGGTGGIGPVGSQSGGGGGAGYGGGGGGGAGNLPGTGTTTGVNTSTGAGGGGSNYVCPTCLTTGLANGTAGVTGNGAVTLTLFPNAIGGTCISLCPGTTTTFTETTPGGVWSSSNPVIATVSATTGSSITVTAGTSVGTTNISYTDPASGYYAFVAVTVLTAPSPISGRVNVCQGNTITLSDAVPGGIWSTANTAVATVANTGVVTGVSAGTAVITYTAPGGCPATYTITVTTQPDPVTGVTVCAGSTILLSDTSPGGNWTSSNTSVATIDPVTGSGTGISAGTATVTYSFGGTCYTTAVVTVNPLPVISSADSTDPDSCGILDGKIVLNGLTSGTSYIVAYDYNGAPATAVTLTAPVTIASLDSGTYTNFVVKNVATGCISRAFGPVTLSDPQNPPPPVVSHLPICLHQKLMLSAMDAWTKGFYSWVGPNGFNSNIENPTILQADYSDTGIYAATYTLYNCISLPGTTDVTIEPSAPLTNVTLSQTIPYGSSIQLNADNAFYYRWAPDDGTLNNPNINNPEATPLVTTTYVVYGMTEFGCVDSSFVTVTVDSSMNTGIPTAFTPNGDGLNDVFRPVGIKYQRLVEFRIYNRWGQQVFYSTDAEKGWDGTFNGAPQGVDVYYYQIIVALPGNTNKNIAYKGDVTLIR